MNYDLVRLARLWLGWLVLAVAHRLARLGNRLAGTDAALVTPLRPNGVRRRSDEEIIERLTYREMRP